MKTWLVVAALLALSLPASADSITFNTELDNVTLVQGVSQLFTIQRSGSTNFMEIDASAGPGPYTMSMSWTLILPNQPAQILSFSDSCASGASACGWIDGFFVPTSYKPVPFTLVVQFNSGSTHLTDTFHESYVSNTPEPASLLLVGTGLAAMAWIKLRRRQNSDAFVRPGR